MEEPPTMCAIEQAIRDSWSADTSDDPVDWRHENPARGQCGTTAFVVRDLLGGAIVVAQIVGTDPQEHHSWNRFSSGFEMDLTRDQFVEPPELRECEIPEAMLIEPFGAQADLLRSRVLERLATSPISARGAHPYQHALSQPQS